jgi:hypothetical protein
MAEEQKPITTAAEPVAPAAEPVVEPTPAEPAVVEPAAAEPAAEATTTEEPAKAEESKEAEAPKEEPTPIYDGILSYTAGGNVLKNLLGLKDKFFFFYGDEAVPAEKFSHLLKPTKAEFKEAIAWSSQTGKGLLYFAKSAEQKASPKGIIALAEVEDVKPVGAIEIAFKLGGHKHSIFADSTATREGWLLSLKENVAAATAQKAEVTGSEGYKEQLEKLSKSTLAPVAVAGTSPKKSTDRARSTEASDKKPSLKERSQSRGKKFFDRLQGKKDVEPVAAEATKAEETTEAAAATEPVATEAVEPVAAPVEPVAEPTPAVEAAEESKVEEPKVDEPKKSRRSSKYYFEKIKGAISPTTEKKPEDIIPTTEASALETAPAATEATPATEAVKEAEPAAEPVVEPTVVEPTAETAAAEVPATNGDAAKAAEPAAAKDRRRSSFFDNFTSQIRKTIEKGEKKAKDVKEDVKPSEETKAEEAVEEEAKPAAEAEAKVEEPVKPAETTEATPAVETAAEAETKEAKPEKKESKIIGLTRNLSKAFRGNKEAKKPKPTEKTVDEAPKIDEKAEETKPIEAPITEAAKEEPKKEDAPNSIGDVVPEAVTVGTAPPASTAVSATA